MVVGRAEGEGGRGRGKRGPSKRGKKKGVGGEGRGGGPPGVGLLVAGEQGADDGGQQQVLLLQFWIVNDLFCMKLREKNLSRKCILGLDDQGHMEPAGGLVFISFSLVIHTDILVSVISEFTHFGRSLEG